MKPIPIGDEVSSLSAILLDEEYYRFLHEHKLEIAGVSLVSEACLIPLKASAWLDLSQRKATGARVDSRDISKHRSDVLRLYQLLEPEKTVALPARVQVDLHNFLRDIESEVDKQLLKNLGIRGVSSEEVFDLIQAVYQIPASS